jgi:hypothetical protein
MKCKIGEKSKRLSVTMETQARSKINTGTRGGGRGDKVRTLSLSLSRECGTRDACDVMHQAQGTLSQAIVVREMTEVCHVISLKCGNNFSFLLGAFTTCKSKKKVKLSPVTGCRGL